jgi:hypothetical protein
MAENTFMGFLTKHGLVEKTEDAPATSVNPPAAPSPAFPAAQAPPMTQSAPPPGVDPAKIAALDESARKQLLDAMEATGSKHFPELKTFLTTLEAAIPSEPARYQTALKLCAAKQISVVALTGDLDAALGALDEKNRVFASELKGQFDNRVGAKAKAVEEYNASIVAKLAQIAALQQENIELTQKRDQEQGGIAEAQAKINLLQQRFTVVYNDVRSSVEHEKTKLLEYSKGI